MYLAITRYVQLRDLIDPLKSHGFIRNNDSPDGERAVFNNHVSSKISNGQHIRDCDMT